MICIFFLISVPVCKVSSTSKVELQHDQFYCRPATNHSSCGTQLIPMYYMQRPFCALSCPLSDLDLDSLET